jgi:hypothetical protein
MRRTSFLCIVAALCIAAFMHCSDDSSGPAGPDDSENPSLANDLQPMFTGVCVRSGCHTTPGAQSLTLSEGKSYSNLVNVNSIQIPALKRVRPGNIDSSYVVNKLDGTSPLVGVKMPKGGTLSAANIQLVKNWISKGAKNN